VVDRQAGGNAGSDRIDCGNSRGKVQFKLGRLFFHQRYIRGFFVWVVDSRSLQTGDRLVGTLLLGTTIPANEQISAAILVCGLDLLHVGWGCGDVEGGCEAWR
jgi:hypothetical protein